MKFNILLFMALLCATAMNAQVKFVGGISYASIQMGKPESYKGSTVEQYSFIGGSNFGLHLEIGRDDDYIGLLSLSFKALWTQIGTNYNYNGFGYRAWQAMEGQTVFSNGTIKTQLEISNTYLKFPILLNINLNNHLSVQLGGYAAYLVRSRGTGTLQYFNGVIEDYPSEKINGFKTALNYNYLDEYNDGAEVGKDTLSVTNPANGMRPTRLGAYYDRNGRTGLMFNRLDLGLNAGITLQAGSWLLMAQVSYGLSDVFNNDYHAKTTVINEKNKVIDEKTTSKVVKTKEFILNKEFQRNISYELSIGFGF